MRSSLLPAVLVAALAAGATGCAAGLLHRRAPAVTTVATATPDERARAKANARAEKAAQRDAAKAAKLAAREAKRARPDDTKRATPAAGPAAAAKPAKAGKHAKPESREQAAAVPHDPLGEARVRAQQNPSEPFWPYRIAQLQAAAGFRPQAEDALRTAIQRDSSYAPALTALSRLLYEQGRHDEAVHLLAPVRAHRVPMPPADRAAVLSGLAMHEAALGRDPDARATLAELAHDEQDDALAASAWLAVRGTENAKALELTERAVKADSRSAANHNNRGIALLRAADPDGAEKEFRRAIELDPSRSGPYYNLAILERFYRLDTGAAAKHFQHYWTRSKADPDSLYAELGHAGTPTPVAEEGPNR
ncbi:MAG: tetratricopeptide repeat protein [Candidatus Eisenbacteria bacterium]